MVPKKLKAFTDILKCGSDGFIRLIDVFGDEKRIVDAARISYKGAYKKNVRSDAALIRYLLRHRHTTPFEMCEIIFHIRVPMDIWRQWVRHRTASINEYSTRYSVAIDSRAVTKPQNWRLQSKTNKQGSSSNCLPVDVGLELTDRERQLHTFAQSVYEERLNLGVAKEQARKDLPLSTYTEVYWKIDLHNLMHFLKLRLDSHAQEEIRNYSNFIAQIFSIWLPNVYDAFYEYELSSVKLSLSESLFLNRLLGEIPKDIIESHLIYYIQKAINNSSYTVREANEFLSALCLSEYKLEPKSKK